MKEDSMHSKTPCCIIKRSDVDSRRLLAGSLTPLPDFWIASSRARHQLLLLQQRVSEELHRQRGINCCSYKGVCLKLVFDLRRTSSPAWYQLLFLQRRVFEAGVRPPKNFIASVVSIVVHTRACAWSWCPTSEELHCQRDINCCSYKGVCLKLVPDRWQSSSPARYPCCYYKGVCSMMMFDLWIASLQARYQLLLLQRRALLFNVCVEILFCFCWFDMRPKYVHDRKQRCVGGETCHTFNYSYDRHINLCCDY